MASTHLDVAKGANVMRDGGDEQADGEEGDEEADGGQEETAMGPVGDLLVDDAAGLGEVEDEQDRCSAEDDEDQED